MYDVFNSPKENSMSKSIENYLPKKGEVRPMQGNVDVGLYDQVDRYRKSKDLTWNELLTAMCQKLIDEIKGKA